MSTQFLRKAREAARRLLPMTNKGQQELLGRITLAVLKEMLKPAVAHKKTLQEVHNHALSLKEGLASSDADKSDVREFIAQMNKWVDQCQEVDDREEQKKNQGPAPKENQPMGDRRVTNDNIRKFERYRSQLPRTVETFKAVRMPVIPISKLPMKEDVLRKYGVSDTSIDGYPVLNNQLVVGMARDWMVDNFQIKVKDDIQAKATVHILDALFRRKGQKYVVLGRGRREGNVMWIWVARQVEAERLYKAAYGGHLTILNWGFAFNALPKGVTHVE